MSSNEVLSFTIGAMRPALEAVREEGNRKAIGKRIAEECGIASVVYERYLATMNRLYAAVCDYVSVKNSPTATADEIKAKREPIYPLWKELLAGAENDPDIRTMRVREEDLENLVGFCQSFMNLDVNSEFHTEFVSTKVYSRVTARNFQKKVETDLGIRMAEIEVLTDAERDLLKLKHAETRKVVKCNTALGNLNKELIIAQEHLADAELSGEVNSKKVFAEMIDDLKVRIENVTAERDAAMIRFAAL